MSEKKLFISKKEYWNIAARQLKAHGRMVEEFIKVLVGGGGAGELGTVLLKFFNKYRSDEERIVAIMNIMFFGMCIKKAIIGTDEESSDEKLKKALDKLRKKGGIAQS